MSLSLFLTGRLLALTELTAAQADTTTPPASTTAPSTLGGIDLNAPAKPLPGAMGAQVNDWLGWLKTLAIAAGIVGILVSGIMMMIGRRNRGHLSAEGATGLLWVIGGLSVISMAGGIVATILGGRG